jgi:protein-tyrosine phosphatase
VELFWVSTTLAVSTRPRGGDWLDVDLARLRGLGVDVLVSCLTAREEAELDLIGEEAAASAAGMTFIRATIDDRSVPSPGSIDPAVEAVGASIRAGRRVAIHCRMGLGRSPMVAAAALIEGGLTADAAMAVVGAARGTTVPETDEQRAWLRARARS